MPSHLHEGLTDLFRSHPALAATLLADALGVALPAYEKVRTDSAELSDVVPTEYRADAVVVLTRDGTAVLAVVIEIQLRRDLRKQWSWPVYVTTLRARLRCPVELLVISPYAGVATACAAPIHLGTSGAQITPLVLGPDLVPVVTDREEAARMPELAVLSAIAHGGEVQRRAVLPALLDGLENVESEDRRLYLELVHTALPAAARRHLEEIMSTYADNEAAYAKKKISSLDRYYIRQGKAEGKAIGEAAGEARAILSVLDARGITVPDDRRTLIAECPDLEQLDVWVRRSATATTVEDLFD